MGHLNFLEWFRKVIVPSNALGSSSSLASIMTTSEYSSSSSGNGSLNPALLDPEKSLGISRKRDIFTSEIGNDFKVNSTL